MRGKLWARLWGGKQWQDQHSGGGLQEGHCLGGTVASASLARKAVSVSGAEMKQRHPTEFLQ